MNRLRARARLSLVFVLTFSACHLSTYRPTPDDQLQSIESSRIETGSPLHFFFYTGVSKLPDKGSEPSKGTLPIEFEVLRRALETVSKPILTETPPDKGTYIVAYKTRKSSSAASQVFCLLSAVTLSAIPCYSGSSGYTVIFNLYQDTVHKKTYKYEVTEKVFIWIGVAPFIWVNGLTTTYERAFEVTTNRFLHDVKRDGHF